MSNTHKTIGNFINGEWMTGSLKTIKNIDPATGESIGEVVVSSKAEVEAAIASAKAAFPAWKRTPAPKRGEILQKAANEMARRKDELARAMALEEGKTLGESGLWERDITVLTLHRGTTVIPNPRKGVVLEAEDRLLCFGKLEEMRSMIPERRRRRAKVRKLPKEPIPEAG